MASLQDDKKSLDEKMQSRDEEKDAYDVAVSESEVPVEKAEGDEALKLVGRERTAQFTEEYNKKLRRKLVRFCFHIPTSDSALTRSAGLDHPPSMRCGVLHAVLVRLIARVPLLR